jgi:hypothetical protein
MVLTFGRRSFNLRLQQLNREQTSKSHIMKIQTTLLTVIAAAAFVVAGCSKASTEAPGTPEAAASVDTSKIEAAFQAAEPAVKSAVDTAVAAIKSADYSGAVTQLKSLGEKFKLTEEQQAAVNELIAKAQKMIEDMATKAAGDATKAATDLAKPLAK